MSFWRELGRMLDLHLFEVSGTPVTLATLISFVLIAVVTVWLGRLMQRAVVGAFARRGKGDEGTAAVSARLARYSVLIIGLGVALNTLGLNLTALFAAGALFAVALGFAMQNLTQNFVSGVILLLERAIKPGDVLEVDGQLVRVLDMGIRATIARTLEEEDLIIPNTQLVASPVKNFTFHDAIYRLRARVGVVYSADMARVRSTLEQVAAELSWRRDDPPPRVLLLEFGSSSVDWDVSVWIDDPWRMRSLRSQLNEAIWWGLRDAGITIAFPQVDVHFDEPIESSLRALGSGTTGRARE